MRKLPIINVMIEKITGFKEFIESYDETNATIEHNGIKLKRKIESGKRFLTPFGEVTIERGLYQADRGGESYVPLDAKWGIESEFATSEDAILQYMGRHSMSQLEVFLITGLCRKMTKALQDLSLIILLECRKNGIPHLRNGLNKS